MLLLSETAAGRDRPHHRCLRRLPGRAPHAGPKSAQPHVATQVRTNLDQADAVAAQYDRVVDVLAPKYPDAAVHLETARHATSCWLSPHLDGQQTAGIPLSHDP
jgi:hypothetical protein